MLTEFILYLNEQLGEPYVWGGQHLELTKNNYIDVITKKESSEKYRQQAIEYCEAMFEDGYEVLYAYDCSGLGMYWLQNVKHIYSKDMSANSMMGCCEIRADAPKCGWWVFRCDSSGNAVHIGYMVDDENLIEAKGRAYGVVKTVFKAKDWSKWGIPKCFKDEIDPEPEPPDPPVPPEPPKPTKQMVVVIGNSVNVRETDEMNEKGKPVGKIMFTAHKRNRFNLIDISADTGWYHIKTYKGPGYISNREDLTCLVTVS